MLKDKVLLGANTIKLPEGFNYITKTLKQTNNMSTETTKPTTGKEALAAIAAHFKKVQESKKIYTKEVTLLNKMVTKFPKKEKEQFADKLAKFTIE